MEINLFISLLSDSIAGSFGLVALIELRSLILLVMFSGRGVWWVLIFPLGM